VNERKKGRGREAGRFASLSLEGMDARKWIVLIPSTYPQFAADTESFVSLQRCVRPVLYKCYTRERC